MNSLLATYQKEDVKDYLKFLNIVCSLSRLYSESDIPFLYYRAAENVFCKAFKADNLSRTDTAYDAKIKNIGIGIKTFIAKSKTKSEKISEFNEYANELRKLSFKDLPYRLAELRNERINFANRTYGIEQGIYHCISRKKSKLIIFETSYDIIDINSVKPISSSDTSIHFKDKNNKYSFLFSKSTLFRNFIIPNKTLETSVKIIEDPYELLMRLYDEFISKKDIAEPSIELISGIDFVFLPLYSTKAKEKFVPDKSGLNQWNAGGRKRNYGEVYIHVPIMIHNRFPDFFPSRDTIFNLHVPTGEILQAKLCQANSKALMTNPNKALADWLLRKVFHLKEGELMTYDKLKLYGIDSVLVTKLDNKNYKIEFSKIDSYSNFIKPPEEEVV